jgi:hypothetical protein
MVIIQITSKSIYDYLTNPYVEGFTCKGGELVKCNFSYLIFKIVILILIILI